MTDFPTLLRGPATVKDEMTAIYLSAKDARRAADYVERLEAQLKAADEVADCLESLLREAEVAQSFNLQEDDEALSAYRKART